MQAGFCHWGAISRNIAIAHSLKSSEDAPMRRPTTYFVTVLIRLTSLSLPKTMNHRQCRLIFVTGGQYHARNKSDRPFLKKSRGRPYETSCFIFLTVLSRLTSQILPKTLNNIQCRMLFVTGVQYHAI